MDFVITAMQERHLDAVDEIEGSVFPDPWSKAMFSQDLEADHAMSFVALQNDFVIGYVNCWLVADECTINRIACCKKKTASRHCNAAFAACARAGGQRGRKILFS